MYGCILSQCNEKDEFDRVEVRGVSLLIVTHCKSRRATAILERVGLVMMSVVMVVMEMMMVVVVVMEVVEVMVDCARVITFAGELKKTSTQHN